MPTPKPTPAPPQAPGDDRRTFDFSKLLPFVLITAALLAYANSFAGDFMLDDHDHILNNPYIRTDLPYSLAERFPPNDRRVVPKLSYLLNYAIDGLEPRGWHLFNLAVHTIAGLALFGVVRRTLWLPRYGSRFDHSATWLAFIIALFWTLHPVQTQAVTYIVQRIESLMGMFFFLMFYCAIRSDEFKGWRERLWWALALLACLLGMLSKEVMATAPILFLIYDRTFMTPSVGQSLRRRWPLYACLSLPYFAAASIGLGDMFSSSATAGFGTAFYTPTNYLLAQTQVLLYYIRLAYWPHPLCLDYFDWIPPSPITKTIPYAIVVAAMVLACLWGVWRRHWLGFLGLAYFLVLAPTSSFMPLRDLVMEHRMYVPLAPIIIATVIAGWWALRWAMADRPDHAPMLRWMGVGVVAAMALTLGLRTAVRNMDYHSQIGMYRSVTEARPGNPRGWRNYAAVLALDHRLFEARQKLIRALTLTPGDIEGWIGLAKLNVDLNEPKKGIEILRELLKYTTDNEIIYHDLGVLVMQQDPAEAERCFREVLRINPTVAQARNNLALLMMQSGRQEEAIAEFRKAIAMNPAGGSEGHNNLAGLLLNLDRTDEAIESYRQAVKNAPTNPMLLNNLGRALMKAGRLDEAQMTFQQAQSLARGHGDPAGQADALANLGDLKARQSQLEAALMDYRQALALRPGWPEYMRRVAWLRATSLPPIRDANEAVAMAEVANQRTGNGVPAYLDALAAAYACAGRYADAAKIARRAASLAAQFGQPKLAAELPARIAAYEAGKPWIDTLHGNPHPAGGGRPAPANKPTGARITQPAGAPKP